MQLRQRQDGRKYQQDGFHELHVRAPHQRVETEGRVERSPARLYRQGDILPPCVAVQGEELFLVD